MVDDFVVGVDLGQLQDFTALSIVEVIRERGNDAEKGRKSYHLRHLERFRLGTFYRDIAARVCEELWLLPGNASVVVDATGVGGGVVELFEREHLAPVRVTITGGDSVTGDGNSFRVPKRELVSTLQVLLESGRLKIAEALPEAQTLVRELLTFRVKINPQTAHDVYGAWREGEHDDLVLSLALACWFGEAATVPQVRARIL